MKILFVDNDSTQQRALEWPKGIRSAYVPIYGGTVFFIKTKEDYEKAQTYLSRDKCNNLVGISGVYSVFTDSSNDTIYLCGVFNEELSTLVHELYHITSAILDTVGIEHGTESGAYLIGELMRMGSDTQES